MHYHGGIEAVATRLSMQIHHSTRSAAIGHGVVNDPSHWNKFSHVRQAVPHSSPLLLSSCLFRQFSLVFWILTHCLSTHNNYQHLTHSFSMHGKHLTRWIQVLELAEALCSPDTMPSYAAMRASGFRGLADAVRSKYGGLKGVAETLGLQLSSAFAEL
mmetsp:Transcript_12723/g.44560  ORF Transcript_12723/g.44560 Transcript_12723/m.44560 type:complete len:158 (+) Transcript_12723:2576-3049(+)